MSSIWKIVWKDLVRFRALLAGWTLLIAAKHLFFGYISGVWGDVNITLLGPMQNGFGLAFSFVAEPLIAYFLVAQLVYEDPPSGKDPFWVTRPITGRQLLAAKLSTAILVFVAWPVLLDVPWWIEGGYRLTDILTIGGGMALVYAIVVLVGFACASITDAYPRYILWTVAGLAGLGIVLVLPTMLLRVDLPSSPDSKIGHVALVLIAVIVISCEIIWHQFDRRFFSKAFAAVVGGTLLVGTLLFSTPLLGLSAWFHSERRAKPEDENIRLSIVGPMRVEDFARNPASALVIPVKIESLPENATAYLNVVGTWKSAASKVWTAPGASPPQQLFARVTRHVLGLPAADPTAPVEAVKFLFRGRYAAGVTFPQTIVAESTSFRGEVRLYLQECKLLMELPVREQTKRFDGGSLSISRMERRGDLLVFNFVTRTPFNLKSVNAWVGYIALLKRSTGELIEPMSSTSRSQGYAQINLVEVSFTTASFKIPATSGWLEGATFVALGFEPGRTLTREIAGSP